MERITIFNYEAFYLDFLEGTLSEEDTALLKSFLEKNPDLLIDEEDFTEAVYSEKPMVYAKKGELKQPDLSDAITKENFTHFFISETEGLLNSDKRSELDQFCSVFPEYQRERKLYGLTHASPDLSITYSKKEGLKRKNVNLWSYTSMAAAACTILFLYVTTPPALQGGNRTTANYVVGKSLPEVSASLGAIPLGTSEPSLSKETGIGAGMKPQKVDNVENRKMVREIKRNPVSPLMTSVELNTISPITKSTFPLEETDNLQTAGHDLASANTSKMTNPIEPITKLVSEKTNTEVDFGHRKKSEDKPSGFYVKIGKFELSHKRH